VHYRVKYVDTILNSQALIPVNRCCRRRIPHADVRRHFLSWERGRPRPLLGAPHPIIDVRHHQWRTGASALPGRLVRMGDSRSVSLNLKQRR